MRSLPEIIEANRRAEEKEKRQNPTVDVRDDGTPILGTENPPIESNILQFPKAYPKHKTEPQLTVYRITVAKRTIDDALDCLEEIKLPGTTITAGIGTWFDDHGELLTERNVTVETSDFTLDKVFKLAVTLLNLGDPEDSAYLTTDGKDPILITKEGCFKHIN